MKEKKHNKDEKHNKKHKKKEEKQKRHRKVLTICLSSLLYIFFRI